MLEAAKIIENLTTENTQLRNEVACLKAKIKWFERELFGKKSEKQVEPNPYQMQIDFGPGFEPPEIPPPPKKITVAK